MSEDTPDIPDGDGGRSPRDRIEEGADRARSGFDDGVVDILSWMLDTETRARIYVYLRQNPWSTSEEVAEGTGLYPSTVREALAELATEATVERRKRESEGAGNNPYEYTAISPSELVGGVVGGIQDELNTVFTLGRESDPETQPVRIEVESGDAAEDAGGEDASSIDVEEESTEDADVEASDDVDVESSEDAGAESSSDEGTSEDADTDAREPPSDPER